MLRFVFACILIAAPISLGSGYLAVSNDKAMTEYCRKTSPGEKANFHVNGQPCRITENTGKLVGVIFAFLTTPAQIMVAAVGATALSGLMLRGNAPLPAGVPNNQPYGFVNDRRRRAG